MRSLVLFVGLCIVAACSGGTNGPVDMAHDMVTLQCCGVPGDTGNSMGIGKYCTTATSATDCKQGQICANIADPRFRYCTALCNPNTDMGGSIQAQCGENSTCQCSTKLGGCGCAPTSCLPPKPGCEP